MDTIVTCKIRKLHDDHSILIDSTYKIMLHLLCGKAISNKLLHIVKLQISTYLAHRIHMCSSRDIYYDLDLSIVNGKITDNILAIIRWYYREN